MSYRIYIVRNGREECLHGYGTVADILDVVKFLRKKARIKWIKREKGEK